MKVIDLRRYPVKAMGGERMFRLTLDARGVVGDRAWAVVDGDGKLASGKNSRRMRRYDRIFDFAAVTEADGRVHAGAYGGVMHPAGTAELDAELSAALDAEVRLTPEADYGDAEARLFDQGAVSLVGSATLAWAAAELGVDHVASRIRANIVVATSEAFAEESWLGRRVRLGEAVVRVDEVIPRCRMIDLAQNGVPEPAPFLKALSAARGPNLAVYCTPEHPGDVAIGDEVGVLEAGRRRAYCSTGMPAAFQAPKLPRTSATS